VAAPITKSASRPTAVQYSSASAPTSHLVDRVLSFGFVVAAVAVAGQTVAHLTNAFFLDYEIRNMDADADGNALSWAASVAIFTAALGAFLFSLFPSVPTRRFVALSAAFVFFSLDEVAAIHEKLASVSVHGLDVATSVGRALWPILYVPLLVFVVISLWRLAATVPDRIRSAILLGLALLAAAVVAEAMSTLWWNEDSRPLIDDLEVAVEEGAELGGWIFVATAFAAILFDCLARAGEPLLPRANGEGL
jgi:hypothetical protein